jgi:hypothetical protein
MTEERSSVCNSRESDLIRYKEKSQRGAGKTIYQEPKRQSLGAVAMTQNSNPVRSPGAARRAKRCLVREGTGRGQVPMMYFLLGDHWRMGMGICMRFVKLCLVVTSFWLG